jgi:hypothetical protein
MVCGGAVCGTGGMSDSLPARILRTCRAAAEEAAREAGEGGTWL